MSLVFCTKNPQPMLDGLCRLDAYGQYWFVTITPFGRESKPGVPEWRSVLQSFQELSGRVGSYTMDDHFKAFSQMASELSGVKSVELKERQLRFLF